MTYSNSRTRVAFMLQTINQSVSLLSKLPQYRKDISQCWEDDYHIRSICISIHLLVEDYI